MWFRGFFSLCCAITLVLSFGFYFLPLVLFCSWCSLFCMFIFCAWGVAMICFWVSVFIIVFVWLAWYLESSVTALMTHCGVMVIVTDVHVSEENATRPATWSSRSLLRKLCAWQEFRPSLAALLRGFQQLNNTVAEEEKNGNAVSVRFSIDIKMLIWRSLLWINQRWRINVSGHRMICATTSNRAVSCSQVDFAES